MNEYTLDYCMKRTSGNFRETFRANSEQDARNLLRNKFNGQEVVVFGSRMTQFSGDRDDRRNDKR